VGRGRCGFLKIISSPIVTFKKFVNLLPLLTLFGSGSAKHQKLRGMGNVWPIKPRRVDQATIVAGFCSTGALAQPYSALHPALRAARTALSAFPEAKRPRRLRRVVAASSPPFQPGKTLRPQEEFNLLGWLHLEVPCSIRQLPKLQSALAVRTGRAFLAFRGPPARLVVASVLKDAPQV
jgi:hypothetical protein